MANLTKVCKTHEESVAEYKAYIDEHIKNVKAAMEKYGVEFMCILTNNKKQDVEPLVRVALLQADEHDESKYGSIEFEPYRKRFYPTEEEIADPNYEETTAKEFEQAWQHHYLWNPHHPEFYGISMSDNTKVYTVISPLYILEMVCDWISVSMTQHSSLYEWWFEPHNAREEKKEMLRDYVVDACDEFITRHKEDLDFSKL